MESSQLATGSVSESVLLLIDSIQDCAIFLISEAGLVTSWNEGAHQMKGYQPDEIIEAPMSLLYTTEDQKINLPDHNLKMARKHGHYTDEGWRVRKDNSRFWAKVIITAFLSESGDLWGYAKLTIDLTEKKNLLERLNEHNNELEKKIIGRTQEIYEQERKFRALVENSAEGIALTDEFSNIIYQSPASINITGIVPTENTFSRVHPKDVDYIRAKMNEAIEMPGTAIQFSGQFRHALGHYFWMEGTLTNMLHINGINAIVSNYRDITKRKETEERMANSEKLYRNLFENLMHGFAYCTCIFENELVVDFAFNSVNGKFIEMTGLEDMTGKNASDVLPNLLDPVKEYMNLINRAVLSGNPEKFETYLENLDKWFAVSLYCPTPKSFIALLDDISISKKAEQKIKLLNIELERKVFKRTEELKKKNDEIEAFSYSVSHDLRAPLRGIIGFATILEEEYGDKLDDEAKRITSVIKSNTKKMGNLIDDLLAFSRLGNCEINKTTIDSYEMIGQIITEFEQKEGTHHTDWVIHPLHSLNGDLSSIKQVWTNLIANAMKYSGGREVSKIEISSVLNEDEIVFKIKDNGVGFDMNYADKLFKVFQRLHGSNEFEGTGVGLAIVEKIVSRHKGKVWAESEIDHGASFYFSIPVHQI